MIRPSEDPVLIATIASHLTPRGGASPADLERAVREARELIRLAEGNGTTFTTEDGGWF